MEVEIGYSSQRFPPFPLPLTIMTRSSFKGNRVHRFKYIAATVLGLLEEGVQVQDVKMDWNSLAKRTSTLIKNAREYHTSWRSHSSRGKTYTGFYDLATFWFALMLLFTKKRRKISIYLEVSCCKCAVVWIVG
nr:hypothetical protein [Tanacetum cinerariifolium]